MASPEEHRLYDIVLKQVLWDEDEEKIRKRLQVNEVPTEEAEAIYQTARDERVRILRSKARETIGQGLIAFLIGAAILGGFWICLKAFHIGVIAGCCIFLGAGLFIALKGTLSLLAAPHKKGSIMDQ